MRKAMIICGFPGVGKTTAANNKKNLLDAESSAFSHIFDPENFGERPRNPHFPENYIDFIEENTGEYDLIFVSSHASVREALTARGIQYLIVAPEKELKNEYLIRYLKRGSDIDFIELLNEKWDEFLTGIENDGAPVIWLKEKETLSNLIAMEG